MDIKLGKNDKRYIEGSDDVFSIMQRVLLRENKIDKEKEHFWIIGMNEAGYILYIELIALGSVKAVNIEPMNVYRVAVMKNASRVIAIHNHPSGRLVPSKADLDITDRLIQVGRILNIALIDHLIISTEAYESFRNMGIMDDLEKSLTYVPTYQVVEQIRKEEKKIARDKVKSANDKTKIERARREKLEFAMVSTLIDKNVSIEDIAKIMEVTPKAVESIVNKFNFLASNKAK
ncbi:JAB domain-containing protein [Snodgrassella sp. ESL0324]|uniref:JAB domain-containing protein n=1 Tax=Snodgrassella sp. ESL0324 TaxID=2705033 RepID=UPI0015841C53|nr:JAB domain-containing protein [Snodgrassella sp. ESL0324]NUF08515.1 JAB domain-containing protein [Snodgrassella sp. ESL0324]